MKTLPVDATDDQILAAVREWVDLLIDERYQEAFDYLHHRAENNWSPHLLETVINNYGSIEPRYSGTIFKITSLETSRSGPEPRHDVVRFDDDPASGYVWFDLPLNGEWSDLTATLDFYRQDDVIVLELNDLHVM